MIMSLFICIVLFSLLESHLSFGQTDEYSDTWIAEIVGDSNSAARIARKYGFYLHEQVLPGIFVLKRHGTRKISKYPSFTKLSKRMSMESEVKSFRQEKWLKRYPRTFMVMDAHWSNMWYLDSSQHPEMNVIQAWNLNYSGQNVAIAVVDDGVDTTHPDLTNYVASLSFNVDANTPDPSPSGTSSHGTECAGVAVATKNNICIIGVAYKAKLAAIKLIGDKGTLASTEAKALTYNLQKIDIFSSSWGGADNGVGLDVLDSAVEKALKLGVFTGRGGRGSIYVWAAGNGGDDDNCNCDGYVNSIYTIGITSVSALGYSPTYAEQCSAILASTYSGSSGTIPKNVYTTTNGGGCVANFSGTSASTPMAAGMIALALEANPNMTWRDVQHLIVQTANSGGLGSLADWIQNAAGRKVSKTFGFGLMNAEGMVKKAANWTYVPLQTKCVGPITQVNEKIQGLTREITSIVDMDPCKGKDNFVDYLEHVLITVNLKASTRGEVQLTIISPHGTESQLLSPRPRDTNKELQWTFMTVHFWGEQSTPGKWTLKMEILNRGETGTLESWSVTLFSTKIDPKLGNPGGSWTNNKWEDDSTGTTQSGDLNIYVIIGAVVATVVVVTALLITFVCLRMHKKTKRTKEKDSFRPESAHSKSAKVSPVPT